MKSFAIFFLAMLMFSCTNHEVTKVNNTQSLRLDALESELARLNQFEQDVLKKDSILIAKLDTIALLALQADTNAKSALYAIQKITRRDVRIYRFGVFTKGFLRTGDQFLTGGKIGDIIDIIKKK